MKTLDLSNNQLDGPIPATLGQLTNLETLDLSSNQLTGSIPPELGNLTNLKTLNLTENPLTGSISSVASDRAALIEFYEAMGSPDNNTVWRHWNSEGSLTKWQGIKTNAEGRVISLKQPDERRDLEGHVLPAVLGRLTYLEELDLSNNRLTGSFPAELGQLVHLETLILNGNELTGPIPPENRTTCFLDISQPGRQ